MSDEKKVPVGRLRRLGRLIALGPKAGAAVAGEALRQVAGQEPGDRLGEVLFDTLGEMKAGSLKAGQLLAQVSDSMPKAARARLGSLFSQAPTLEWSVVAGVLEAELGAPPEERFAHIDPEPAAAASLGQVHRARLHDGRIVAVKVQYPDVADALLHDLDLLGVAIKASGAAAILDAGTYFNALREETLAELDYLKEAASLERMAEAVAPWPDLVVPGVVASHTTGRVLTIDWLEGPTLHEHFTQASTPEAREALALQMVRAVVGPLFRCGLVNADAHPGNFIVLADGRLGLLDFGAVSEVPEPLIRGLADLVRAVIDPTGHDLVARFAAAGIDVKRADRGMLELLEELAELFHPILSGPCDYEKDTVLERMGVMKRRHPVRMMRMHFDPAVFPVFRAEIGVYHALKQLCVVADIGPVLLELARDTTGG